MNFKLTFSLICASLLSARTLATPAVNLLGLETRQQADNIVYVTDANLFWYVWTQD